MIWESSTYWRQGLDPSNVEDRLAKRHQTEPNLDLLLKADPDDVESGANKSSNGNCESTSIPGPLAPDSDFVWLDFEVRVSVPSGFETRPEK